ncbi:HDOD domain-containing protein [Desulfovibrio sp. OttesenSCG-928-C14]|nr:HDOD domain-containing protein [Desulfovibrio sp. OttesenSCG-928-C14]
MSSNIKAAHEFLNDLADNPPRLPFEPTLLPKLFKKLSDDNKEPLGKLVELVEQSQGLAAKVLSIANSACYGLQGKVNSLYRAVQVLGLIELRSLVLFFSVSEAMPRKLLPKEFPAMELWEHQIRTGMLGRQMAKTINATQGPDGRFFDAESIYAAGLLHDMGKVVLAYKLPDAWAEITALSQSRGCNFAAAEDEYWGIDHGTVASILLRAWGLPELLTEMISWHHHPALAPDYKDDVRILAAANTLAVQGLDEEGRLPAAVLEPLPEYAPALQADTDIFADLLHQERAAQIASFA